MAVLTSLPTLSALSLPVSQFFSTGSQQPADCDIGNDIFYRTQDRCGDSAGGRIGPPADTLAERLGLIPTGGSDCHGDRYDPIRLGTSVCRPESFAALRSLAAR